MNRRERKRATEHHDTHMESKNKYKGGGVALVSWTPFIYFVQVSAFAGYGPMPPQVFQKSIIKYGIPRITPDLGRGTMETSLNPHFPSDRFT